MTPQTFRLLAALIPLTSWTLVAPASPSPEHHSSLRAAPAALVEAATLQPAFGDAAPPLAAVAPQPDTGLMDETSRAPFVHPWRRLLKREITSEVVANANAIIRKHHVIGEEVLFTVAGEQYLARIEEHYHAPGGDKYPWGPHPGVSVFVARPAALP